MLLEMMKQFQYSMKNAEEDSRRLRRDLEEQKHGGGYERGWGWQDEDEGRGIKGKGKGKAEYVVFLEEKKSEDWTSSRIPQRRTAGGCSIS